MVQNGTPGISGKRIARLDSNRSRKLISVTLYEALTDYAPPIATEPAIARFTLYATFSTFRSPSTGHVVLPTPILAEIAGVPLRADGERWERGGRWANGDDFLSWIRETAYPGLDVTAWNGAAGFAREIRSLGLPLHLDTMMQLERSTSARERGKAIDPVLGQIVGTRAQKTAETAVLAALVLYAQTLESDRAPDHPTTRLMVYMNARSPRLLSGVLTPAKFAAARVQAGSLDTEGQRAGAYASLDYVEAVGGFQVYKTTPNSTRNVPEGPGLNGMWVDGREMLLDHKLVFKVDLAKAQLAINAMLYGITKLHNALRRRQIGWAGFLSDIGAEVNAGTLAAVKRAVYGLAYGGSDNGTIWRLTGINPVDCTYAPTGITRAQALAFLELDLIAELRGAMNRELAKVETNGGARDAFGDWISLDVVRDRIATKGDTQTDPARSVLAQVAQSWEVLLMQPIIDRAIAEDAKATPGFQLAVWLWDGCYVKVRRPDDAEKIGRELKKAVDAHADALGIATFLEVG